MLAYPLFLSMEFPGQIIEFLINKIYENKTKSYKYGNNGLGKTKNDRFKTIGCKTYMSTCLKRMRLKRKV